MIKIHIFDRRVIKRYLEVSSAVFTGISAIFLFVDIPADFKLKIGISIAVFILLVYIVIWWKANGLQNVSLNIDGSTVSIKTGDIFSQDGLKVIAFNEYFDTLVDDRVIAKRSLNGIFIEKYLDISVSQFDQYLSEFPFDENEILDRSVKRRIGKSVRYRLGTIFLYKDFILTAFSRFDDNNKAYLTMPEYLEFLINFWDSVNRVYAQKSVSTTIFGSGITRIKGHKNISDEELLKIMLWTFRISEMRFKYPAKLTIVIHPEKIDQINLLDVMSAKHGV